MARRLAQSPGFTQRSGVSPCPDHLCLSFLHTCMVSRLQVCQLSKGSQLKSTTASKFVALNIVHVFRVLPGSWYNSLAVRPCKSDTVQVVLPDAANVIPNSVQVLIDYTLKILGILFSLLSAVTCRSTQRPQAGAEMQWSLWCAYCWFELHYLNRLISSKHSNAGTLLPTSNCSLVIALGISMFSEVHGQRAVVIDLDHSSIGAHY